MEGGQDMACGLLSPTLKSRWWAHQKQGPAFFTFLFTLGLPSTRPFYISAEWMNTHILNNIDWVWGHWWTDHLRLIQVGLASEIRVFVSFLQLPDTFSAPLLWPHHFKRKRADRRGRIQQDEAWQSSAYLAIAVWFHPPFSPVWMEPLKMNLAARGTGRPAMPWHCSSALPCRAARHQRVREGPAVWREVSQCHARWVGSELPHLPRVHKVRVFTTFSALFVPTPHSKVSGTSPRSVVWAGGGIRVCQL